MLEKHRRNFVCDGGDSHHHFFKVEFAYFHIKKYQFFPIPWSVGNRIVFFFLPEAFCGLKHAENAIAAGAPPRTQLGELTTLS